MSTAKYLWIDLETTGLDPNGDEILEVAVIVTDGRLRELESWEMVLEYGPTKYVDDYVLEMHTASGLWLACEASDLGIDDLEEKLRATIERYTWEEKKPILAGSTVHFDRSFLAATIEVEHLLHHRHLDASSLKMALVDTCAVAFEKNATHRAMADIRGSLEQVRRIYEGMAASSMVNLIPEAL